MIVNCSGVHGDSIRRELHSDPRLVCLQEKFDILEGEDLCLPAVTETLDHSEYLLYKMSIEEEQMIEDCTDQIIQEGQFIYLSNLTQGSYVMTYMNSKQPGDIEAIQITVHAG